LPLATWVRNTKKFPIFSWGSDALLTLRVSRIQLLAPSSPLPWTNHFAMAPKYGAVQQHAEDDTAAAAASPPPSLAATVNTNNKMLVATVFVGCFLLLASTTSLDTLGRAVALTPGCHSIGYVDHRHTARHQSVSFIIRPPFGGCPSRSTHSPVAKLRREARECHRPSRLLRQPPRSRTRSSPRVNYGTIGRPCSSRPCAHGRGERYKSNAVDDDLAA
jgi:hypothetical protein